MNRFFKSISFLLILSLSVFALSSAHGEETLRLTILHVNDLHGHILPYMEKSVSEKSEVSGATYLSKMIEAQRAKNPDGTLLLAAGDMFQGTPISNIFHGKPVIEIMNHLKFDAMTLGNHEFDWGREALRNLISVAHFPFLSANIMDPQGSPLPGTKPYILLARNNLKIAVIGVTTPETSYTTNPNTVSDLSFPPPEEILPGVIEEARGKGASFIVVLSHLGLDADIELATRVAGIDVIVGGHSHTAVDDPVKSGETVIVQAGFYCLYLGVLDLQIDPSTHKIAGYTSNKELRIVVANSENERDAGVDEILAPYSKLIKDEFARVVGDTKVDLLTRPYEESNLGDLICDAMREASGAEIAFQNGGGIRANLNTGKITQELVYTVLPFDNQLVSMDLTGDQIVQLLEKSGSTENKILQVSGLSVAYDMRKPKGARIQSVKILEENPSKTSGQKAPPGARSAASSPSSYVPIRPEKIYRVVTNDFLAAGGDQFVTFKEGKKIVYGENLRDILTAYLGNHSPVTQQVEERITFLK